MDDGWMISPSSFGVFFYLPEEVEAKCDLDRSDPHAVEVNHEVHQLLGVS